MRRADRLFRLVQILRRRKLCRACDLAEELEVSERTIYRDIRDLAASGVPVEGEAGVGYILRDGYDLPPLMFDADEIEVTSTSPMGESLMKARVGEQIKVDLPRGTKRFEVVEIT